MCRETVETLRWPNKTLCNRKARHLTVTSKHGSIPFTTQCTYQIKQDISILIHSDSTTDQWFPQMYISSGDKICQNRESY